MSDVKAAKKDQGVLIGSLDTATEKDGSWTKVLTLPKGKLDQGRLRTLVVDLTRARLEHLELDEIVFLSAGDVVPARHRTNLTRIGAPLQRASWAWNTAAVLESETEKKKLLGTIARWKLTEIYLQLPHHRDDAESAAWSQGDRGAKLGTLIRDLHRAGVAVHALDGAPYLALRQAHGELAEIALTVKRFNESQPADSRFDALHLDIEPYLLPGFNSSRRRPILHEFANALRATKAAIAPLPLWIDIPFWFDSRDATTVERGARAGCARRDFLDEAMNIVDGIGIMAYRTNPDGADGIAAHALTEVQLANKLQRDVRVGLETIRLPPEVSWSVSLKSEPAMEPGKPLALFAADESHLLFTLAPTAADIAWIQKKPDSYRALKVTREDEAPAAKVTFFGRPKLDIEKAITETVELLSRGGAMTGGVAIHESRTLPE